jgi:hypothetical protein
MDIAINNPTWGLLRAPWETEEVAP